MRHLVVRGSLVTLAAAWILVIPGCRSSDSEATSPDAGAERPPRSGVELRAIVNALVEQLGEDAYADPSLDPIVEELARSAAAGDEDAKSLRGLVLAKRRLAQKASSKESATIVKRVDHGVLRMEGEAPKDAARIRDAETIGLGASRAALLDAYGSCLVRQTWFRARNINDMTRELFHVVPECRDRLTPRVFTVGADKVIRVSPGNLDMVMTGNAEDDGSGAPH